MPPMTTNGNHGFRFILLLAAALTVWCLLLALGAYLGPEYWSQGEPLARLPAAGLPALASTGSSRATVGSR